MFATRSDWWDTTLAIWKAEARKIAVENIPEVAKDFPGLSIEEHDVFFAALEKVIRDNMKDARPETVSYQLDTLQRIIRGQGGKYACPLE